MPRAQKKKLAFRGFDDEAFSKSVFQARCKPSAWLATARFLHEAAEILFDSQKNRADLLRKVLRGEKQVDCVEFPNYRPAEMLFGFSLECLVKGLLVQKCPALINSESLSNDIKSHKLASLATQAGLKLSEKEHRVLLHLTKITEWAGRYPIPLNYSGIVPKNATGCPDPAGLQWGRDHKIMRHLYRRWQRCLDLGSGASRGSPAPHRGLRV